MRLSGWISGAGLIALAGCGGAEAKPRQAGVVDSIVPRDTAIARFHRAVPRADSFTGGASSRDQLVHRFIAAVESRDSVTLGELAMNAAEFGWLYYPTHPEGLAPYNLSPQLMWFMLQGNSRKGYTRLLRRRSGGSLGFIGYRCDEPPARFGQNTIWGPCEVQRRLESGDTLSERLFGQIVEREGRYKFVSYGNKL